MSALRADQFSIFSQFVNFRLALRTGCSIIFAIGGRLNPENEHRVARAAALAEYSPNAPIHAADSPYARGMSYNDIVNVVAETLAAKGLAFWKWPNHSMKQNMIHARP